LVKIFGIDVGIHWTFWIIAAAIVYMMAPAFTVFGTLFGIWIVVVLLATVVGHELAHSLIARRFGHETHHIIMYIFGGIASIKGQLNSRAEFWVALAGPGFNIFVAIVAFLLLLISPEVMGYVWGPIIYINLILGIFNLVPAYPMDGGRVLRSGLAMRYGMKKATEVAHLVGQIIAGIFFFIGIFFVEPMLVIIAGLVVYMILKEQGKI
jgi:Zn-dependent protease